MSCVKSAESRKYHFLYKTTNLINGRYYIGAHSSDSLDDGYLGSGKLLNQAIRKYGRINFSREILEFFDTREMAFLAEKEMVDSSLVENSSVYNIQLGGLHGPTMIGENHPLYGIERPDARERMSKNNPSKLDHVAQMLQTTAVGKELSTGMTSRFDLNDPRWSTGELSHVNKGKITVRDKDGDCFHVSKDDPRWETGEITHVSQGIPCSAERKRKISEANLGKTHSEETKKKMRGRVPWNKGSIGEICHSPDTIEKMRMSAPRTPKPKIRCPKCGKEGGVPSMKRWHFDNCREV